MNSRFFCVLMFIALTACGVEQTEPIEERPYLEPAGTGTLYPAPTDDTVYELVEDLGVISWRDFYGSGGDLVIGFITQLDPCPECGSYSSDTEEFHFNLNAKILVRYDMPFSLLNSYFWIKTYEGFLTLDDFYCTPDGLYNKGATERAWINTWYGEDAPNAEVREKYDGAIPHFDLHTSSSRKNFDDVDVVFDIRVFDRITGRYFKSHKFHLIIANEWGGQYYCPVLKIYPMR